jgi:hypothetical protein
MSGKYLLNRPLGISVKNRTDPNLLEKQFKKKKEAEVTLNLNLDC